MTEGRVLRTWHERVAAPLKSLAMEPVAVAPAVVRATPPVAPEPRPRLEQIGPTTWVLADWAKALCTFCSSPLAQGDTIACQTHRAALDAESMPWETSCGPVQAVSGSSQPMNRARPTPMTTAAASTAPTSDVAPRCHGCGEPLGRDRLTLPRARTGDLVFHSYACQERWRAASTANQEALCVPTI